MFFAGHYQHGYVTHDLDQAMALAARRFGLKNYVTFDPASSTVRTPEGERRYDARVASAWSGGLQIELIQPLGHTINLYRDALPDDPADPAPRFHHVALRRADLPAMRREVAAAGAVVPLAGEVPGMAFVYLDLRAELGHHVELVWASDAMWDYLGWPAA